MKKSKYKVNSKKKIAIYLFILLVILFIYIFINSNIFNLKKVDIKGNFKINQTDIIKIGNIKYGENIFKCNLKCIQKKLELNPYIKSAKLKRKIPNILIINIEENCEYAVIKEGNNYIYLGKEGVVLSEENKLKNKNVPLISGVGIKYKEINQKIKLDSINTNNIILAIDLINKNCMEKQIKSIKIDKNKVNFKTNNNLTVNLSLDEDIEYNINRLKVILIDLNNNHKKGGNLNLNVKGQAIYSD